MNPYIGHDSQICGVEEHRLVGGKGDGMRLLEVRNGRGLAFTVSADRCADISRLTFNGVNCGYFAPCGYVAPAYYEREGAGFLNGFTAGFLTTCGLATVGAPGKDGDELLPLHGTISNTPCETISWRRQGEDIVIEAVVADARLFGRKLKLRREIRCSTVSNLLTLTDEIENESDEESPLMVLYHINIGYPLLSETAVLSIPSNRVLPRDARSKEGLENWSALQPPTPGFTEQCYYHSFPDERGYASIWNPAVSCGLEIQFDARSLDHLTHWKQMGVRDYVIGLEPGNCGPEGRVKVRQNGELKTLLPGKTTVYTWQARFFTEPNV
ncbi:MAG TPA: aldose 1-epimerase family protein [Candidatus Cryosericum sp.]|nr:aldose 1-epimerase family protein [Candidatus Cryosericum sp.]